MVENKVRSRRQTTMKFWVILVISALVGGIGGFLSQMYEKSIYEAAMDVRDWSISKATYIMIVVSIIILASALFYYFRAKRLVREWDQEDEEMFDIIDKTQGIALMITTTGSILTMIIFGLIMANIVNGELKNDIILDMVGAGVFIVINIAITFLQRKIVDETKKLRPEKQGDALEVNFRKTWVESCDEQERQKIYKAAYKAFTAGNVLYIILFIVLVIGQVVFHLGIAPMLVLGIIWLIQTVVYQLEAMKM